MDPPEQTALRRIVVPHMRPAKIRQLEGVIVEAVDGLADKALAEGGAEEDFDFVHQIAAQLPLLIIGRMLGAPAEACPHMQRWTNQMASEDPDTAPARRPWPPRGTRCSRTSANSSGNAAPSRARTSSARSPTPS